MDVKLPDGTLLRGVPDDATKPEIEAFLKAQGYDTSQLAEPERPSYVSQLLANVPESAAKQIRGIVGAVTSPVDTAKGLANLATGAVELAIPGEQGAEQYPRALAQLYRDRYGSLESAKETLRQDPVGVLADASVVLTGGGAAMAKAPVVGAIGSKLRTAGLAADPLNLAINGAKAAVGAVTPESLPVRMYESAAKFSTTIPKAERDVMVRTALEEGIAPTSGGVDKAARLIDALDAEVSGLIERSTQAGTKIPRSEIFRFVNDARRRLVVEGSPEAASAAAVIDDYLKGYVAELNKRRIRDFTPEQMQRIKRDVYDSINWQQDPKPKNEMRKAIARGARESIESAVPEVGPLNAREGALITLKDNISRSANRIDNRNILGIDLPLRGVAGNAMGGPVGAAAAAGTSVLGEPALKARAAIALDGLRRMGLPELLTDNGVPMYALRRAAAGGYNTGGLLAEEDAAKP